MTEDKQALVAHRLDRARESCEEAELLLDAAKTNAAVNRLYYACFYAVSAALLQQGLSSPKHTGVRALFHRRLVKPGIVSTELGKFFDLVFNNRQKGDYSDFVRFDLETVRLWLGQARTFVERFAEVARREDG